MRQQRHRPPGGALGSARPPGRAGDVEVRPAQLSREALQEHGAEHRAGGAIADVGDIGEIALQRLVVLGVKRHAPGRVARGLASNLQFGCQAVVRAEQPGAVVAERGDAGACERGDVDHGRGVESLGVGECIAQDEPAFGIGVENLDGLPAHARDDVAGLDRSAAGHVLACRNDADQVDLGLERRDRMQRAEHAGCATHVVFHFVHLGAGLERDAPGVEGDALAHEHHRGDRLRRSLPARDDELQRLVRALRNGQEGAHAELLHVLAVQHLDLQAVFLAQAFGLLCEIGRGAMVCRQVGALARQFDAGGDCLADAQAPCHGGGLRLAADEAHARHLGGRRRAGLRRTVDIQRVVDGRHQRLAMRLPELRGTGQGHDDAARATAFDGAEARRHGLAEVLHRAVTGCDEEYARGLDAGNAVRIQHGARLENEVACVDGGRRGRSQRCVELGRHGLPDDHDEQRIGGHGAQASGGR